MRLEKPGGELGSEPQEEEKGNEKEAAAAGAFLAVHIWSCSGGAGAQGLVAFVLLQGLSHSCVLLSPRTLALLSLFSPDAIPMLGFWFLHAPASEQDVSLKIPAESGHCSSGTDFSDSLCSS